MPGDPSRHWIAVCLAVALWLYVGVRVVLMFPFMWDPANQVSAVDPIDTPLDERSRDEMFFIRHNCFTSYVVGAQLADQGVDNIYEPDLYRDGGPETPLTKSITPSFTVDRFQYPPPFLLFPQTLLVISQDFVILRRIWFFLNLGTLLLALVALAVWAGGWHARSLVGAALVLAAPTTLAAVQVGNAHLFVMCLAVLGMLFLEKQRYVAGGLLLAFAIVSKLWPGVLIVYLLFGRRWRAISYTLGALVGFSAAALVWFGANPFRAFIHYQLPRLVSGEAFEFATHNIRALTMNLSVPGIAYKLARLGLPIGEPQAVAKVMTTVYTIVISLILGVVGIRQLKRTAGRPTSLDATEDRAPQTLIWVLLVVLGQLRSPFLPMTYGAVTPLWLLTLLLPRRGAGKSTLFIVAWLLVGMNMPLPWVPQTSAIQLVYTLAVSLVILIICGVALKRAFALSPVRET